MPGNLSVSDLKAAIAADEIDTVIVAFADAQGRLVGKRVSARLFEEEVLPHGAEACNYILSVDVDMNTVDDMVEHYLHQARIEVEAYDAAVTDWERIRGFERL